MIGGGGPSANTKSLTLKDVEAIATQVAGVKAVAPQISSQYQVSAEASNTNVTVTGTTVDFPDIRSVERSQLGAWFTDRRSRTTAPRVAVLGPTTAETLFGSASHARSVSASGSRASRSPSSV